MLFNIEKLVNWRNNWYAAILFFLNFHFIIILTDKYRLKHNTLINFH